MDSSYDTPLSPAQSSIIDDDESHKCRRCDLAILEGHAYELGGDRWHMYCFSCSKCSKLLGTSSNFLVLGTGDLICSDCSYACNACGKKIDDLAILTGDQAYCSSCFCCRNCKKRIEDLKYARTSKGLFCMSCHEKLLEKKRKHDNDKRLRERTQSKLPNPEKSLPKVPSDNYDAPRISEDYTRTLSPTGTTSSDLSTPGVEVSNVTSKVDIADVPPRSPERVPVHPSPRYASYNRLTEDNSLRLDPPASVSPMRFPAHLSPMDNNEEEYFIPQSTQSTPKTTYLGVETPERLQTRSPLRQTILTPNGKNRQAIVLGDSVSSSSSNNILSNYINESPPPKIAPPKLPDDDFIDMNDSDEDSKYTRKPSGFSEIRHSDSIPKGLNIQGLPSFDEHFDKELQVQKQKIEQEKIEEEKTQQQNYLSPDIGSTNEKSYTHQVNHQRSYSANTNHTDYDTEITESARSWKSIMSPTGSSTFSPNKKEGTTPSQLQKSRSIRSPKNFLNFRKHKKSISQTSVENYKISSPLMESRGQFDDGQFALHTPRLNHLQDFASSPHQGAALFTTPPVPDSEHLATASSSARKQSMHGRSRSDANVESHDLIQSELELRSLRTEIRDLKVTRHGILREVNELSSTKESMSMEISQLQAQINQLKLQLQGQSSKSSLEDISESTTTSQTQHPQGQPQSAQSQQSNLTSSSNTTPTVAIAEQVHVDPKQKPAKTRFWKRFGGGTGKTDGMSVSQSAYSLSQLLNDGTGSNGAKSNGNLQISAPMLRTEETDELGGNDNKKLMSAKGLNLENGNSSGASVATNGSTLIMSDLFNSTLEMRSVYEKRPIPLIVSRLVQEVEKRGLDSEGIYRKNGATSQMNAIMKAFNNLYQAETSQELENSLSNCDVNALTSSLKRYMYYHLPEPVITMQVYDQFIGVSKLTDEDAKIDSLAQMIMQLPRANAKVLILMLTHLKKIQSFEHLNKMTFHNLSVVFAPTFARVSDGERELMDMASRNNATEFLMVRQDEIFEKVRRIE